MKPKKIVIMDGVRFVRDERTGYYLANKCRGRYRVRLHRYVWEKNNGPIPRGCHIHHKDHNKANNAIENLEMMTEHEHRLLHGRELTDEQRAKMRNNLLTRAVPAAKSWHSSPEGIEWHKRHARVDCGNLHALRKIKCAYCGKEVMGTHNQKFCCGNCKQRWMWRQEKYRITLVCPICGKEYKTYRFSPSETCSHSCANVLSWRERRARKVS